MSTEKLVIELDAKTQKLEAALTRVEEDLQGVADKTKKTDSAFKKFSNGAGIAAGGAVKLGTAALALATAITAVVLASAASQRELAILSRQAKLSTDDFEALAFATKQYGINAEQIADISKDLSDKLGEFGKAGTGAFQDFADVTGLTKEQAMSTAREFQNLSGDQVIGEMVRRMEEAGATSNEMTFALESMGNDLSRLAPLFVSNSTELNKLTGTYKKATEQLKLTNAEIEGLQGVATSFDLMTDSLGKAGSLISASLAPLLNEFFGGVIDVVPGATQVIVDFINTFKKAEDIKSIDSMNRLIEDQKLLVQELRIEMNALGTGATLFDSDKSLATQKQQLNLEIQKEIERIDELVISRDKLAESEALADAQRKSSGSIGGTFDPNNTSEADATKPSGTGDEIQAIADRFKEEEVLLFEKLQRELGIVGENDALKLQLKQEYVLALMDIDNELTEVEIENLEKVTDAEEKAAKDKRKYDKERAASARQYASAASAINSAFFDDNKAVGAGLIIANTAIGVSEGVKLGYPAAIPAVAAAIATGAGALASLNSSSKGGGSLPATISAPPRTVDATEPEETSTLNVSDTDTSGESQSQQITIKIDSDDNELAVALNGILGKAKVSGAIS